MKVSFKRSALANAVALIQNSVSDSGALPILGNIKLEAESEPVRMTGTDLETFARVTLEGRIEEAGSVTLPGKKLAEIARLLPDDDVAIVTAGTKATLTCGRSTYQLSTMDADDFPEWPKTEHVSRIVLPQKDLKRILAHTTFAIPQRDPRKVLMGALFTLIPDKGLVCVATDGRKLGKVETQPIEVVGKNSCSAIIPGRALLEVQKAMAEEGEVEIGISRRQAVFKTERLEYLTSLVEGNYPNYSAVIPDSFKKRIDLPRAAFDEAVVRAGILAERKFNSIVLSFEKDRIEIQAQTFEAGQFRGEVEISFEGEPFKIAFSHQYLHEVFKIIPDAVVHMEIKDSSAPVVFKFDGDPGTMFLVMPVRMSELEPPDEEEDEDDEGDDRYDDEDEDEE